MDNLEAVVKEDQLQAALSPAQKQLAGSPLANDAASDATWPWTMLRLASVVWEDVTTDVRRTAIVARCSLS